MKKAELLKLWDKMFKSKHVEKSFEKMMQTTGGCGWRTLTLKRENVCVEISLIKYPTSYYIEDEKCRVELDPSKEERWKKMCMAFDKRGTLEELSIERLDELLK